MAKLFIRCLEDALVHGRISQRKGREIRALLERYPNLDDVGMLKVLEEKGADIERKASNAVRQSEIMADRVDTALNHPNGPATGAYSWLVRDVTGRSKVVPFEKQYRALLARWDSKFAEALSAMRTRSLGWSQDVALVKNVIRELHGKDTGDARAKAHAKAFKEIAEEARTMFNEAGGNIKLRQDWGSPQLHDARKIRATSKAEWIAYTLPRLDPARMYDADGLPISPAALPEILDKVYDNIVTRGYAYGNVDLTAMKDRHMDPRILAYKDADSWMEYQGKFGQEDLFSGLTSHIDMMAREIAAMQTFGPKPDVTYSALREQAAAHGGWVNTMDHVYDHLMGRDKVPGAVRFANVMAAVRAEMSSAKLGAAFLSSLSDWGFQGLTAHFNGLSLIRVAKNYFKLMQAGSSAEEFRIWATKLGIAADAWKGHVLQSNRFVDQALSRGFWEKMSETVYRASLLQSSTDAGRAAFGLEYMGVLGERAGKTLKEIDAENPRLARQLRRYGIDDVAWDDIRVIDRAGRGGVQYISVEKIAQSELPAARKNDLISRLLNIVDSEADFAVPMPDARVHGHMLMGTRPGTVPGEFVRMGGMWRSFALTTLYTHGARMLYAGSIKDSGSYLVSLALVTTGMGMIAYQAKQVAKGLDPYDWDDPRLVIAGFFQGGGAGIVGDLLQGSMRTRYGNSPWATVFGPGAAAFEDLYAYTAANLGAVAQGQDPRLPKDMVSLVSRYTPGSSLWYARAAIERLMFDQLMMAQDRSGAARHFREKEKFWREQAGSAYWWRPGTTSPQRLPQSTSR